MQWLNLTFSDSSCVVKCIDYKKHVYIKKFNANKLNTILHLYTCMIYIYIDMYMQKQ